MMNISNREYNISGWHLEPWSELHTLKDVQFCVDDLFLLSFGLMICP